ncbi:glutaminase [Hoyosella rhizosphaerae]|uniref:Glutaminase n=1 Tax=Hoyosella rhizosphaerae TaxID=1755582 RepID=A0A916U070_9ACTN|nr:glutaminase [Hoyosella rhizosphaerae]MBN4927242.1 glutaminase [Hoyosella rhizosphaerae]GGC52830.1 glutaminase [Hoyosella rhizosphaerae]
MESPIPDYLRELLDRCTGNEQGAVADYIPELARANPDRLGIAMTTVEGATYTVGDADIDFSIQSISKPFTYGLALSDAGFDAVLSKIGVEPSGDAFNEISLEEVTGKPFNPMINAGAITAHSLVNGADSEARVERIREHFSALAGRELSFDEAVNSSEFDTAHRNLAIGYMLKTVGILEGDPVDVVRGYIRQCSLNVTARDLSIMAATLANGGVQPNTGERLFWPSAVRQALSVMLTCGMYDAAGDWMSVVGIPAKSGVAGGLIGVLPGQIGIAVFSPKLDDHGNSVRGVKLFERLSRDMGLHLMETPTLGRASLRSDYVKDGVHVFEVQGVVRFAGAEAVVRSIAEGDQDEDAYILDLSRVYELGDVARRMLLEVVRRLTLLDKKKVAIVDPDEVLPDPDAGDGVTADVFATVSEAMSHVKSAA